MVSAERLVVLVHIWDGNEGSVQIPEGCIRRVLLQESRERSDGKWKMLTVKSYGD
jgi:hypothetical protein